MAAIEANRQKSEVEARQRAEKEQKLSAEIETLRKVKAQQLQTNRRSELRKPEDARLKKRAAVLKLRRGSVQSKSLAGWLNWKSLLAKKRLRQMSSLKKSSD